MLAPMYIRDFIVAFDLTNSLLARAVRTDLRADSFLKQSEAIAYLDRAGPFLKEKGIKDTAEARKRYVPMDPDVLTAHDAKARTAAMLVFLKNKLSEFRYAYDAVKKIAYSNDYNHNTDYEGM